MNRQLSMARMLGVGAALVLGTLSPSFAAAAPQDPRIEELRVRALVASTCFQCHGTHGRSVPGTATASLPGMNRDLLRAQLMGFRDGTRQGTVMNQFMRGFTPEQINAIATYFSQLRP